jgi:hypothetical protein
MKENFNYVNPTIPETIDRINELIEVLEKYKFLLNPVNHFHW